LEIHLRVVLGVEVKKVESSEFPHEFELKKTFGLLT
jgi:hypothetical protein